MKIASRLSQIKPSPTLAIDAKAKAMKAAGEKVLNFGIGEPDFDTPAFIKEAAIKAIGAGFTKYTPSAGTPALREAIRDKFLRDNRLDYAVDEILVSCGAKHSLYNIFMAAVDPGDEVIIPSPYWVSYPPQVLLAGGVPVFWETTVAEGFLPDPEKLEHLVTKKTVALVLNSPCNPTGAAYDADLIQRILRVAMRHDLLIISDEIYEKMVYEGFSHVSPATVDPEVKARTVVVNGVSKEFAMTGWRIGYLAGPKDLVKAMDKIQSQSTSNATSISQKAAEAALRGDGADVAAMVAEFDRRRRLIVEGLNAIPGVHCPVPMGAFYAFADFSSHHGKRTSGGKAIDGSAALAEYLLDEAKIAAVPGVAFGDDACCRFSYATSTETITEGLSRIREALSRLS